MIVEHALASGGPLWAVDFSILSSLYLPSIHVDLEAYRCYTIRWSTIIILWDPSLGRTRLRKLYS